jgi:hypothetical protein
LAGFPGFFKTEGFLVSVTIDRQAVKKTTEFANFLPLLEAAGSSLSSASCDEAGAQRSTETIRKYSVCRGMDASIDMRSNRAFPFLQERQMSAPESVVVLLVAPLSRPATLDRQG